MNIAQHRIYTSGAYSSKSVQMYSRNERISDANIKMKLYKHKRLLFYTLCGSCTESHKLFIFNPILHGEEGVKNAEEVCRNHSLKFEHLLIHI